MVAKGMTNFMAEKIVTKYVAVVVMMVQMVTPAITSSLGSKLRTDFMVVKVKIGSIPKPQINRMLVVLEEKVDFLELDLR